MVVVWMNKQSRKSLSFGVDDPRWIAWVKKRRQIDCTQQCAILQMVFKVVCETHDKQLLTTPYETQLSKKWNDPCRPPSTSQHVEVLEYKETAETLFTLCQSILKHQALRLRGRPRGFNDNNGVPSQLGATNHLPTQ